MKICIECGKKIKNKLICETCKSNPFRVEGVRKKLAEINDYENLKNFYAKELAEIPNLNTSKFWDTKMEKIQLLQNQDGMTKDRIKTALSFLPTEAKRVLDIGAGNGYLEELLNEKKNIEVYSNDFSQESVANLKKRFRGNFEIQSMYKLKYPLNLFDAVFVLEVLEHIPPSKLFKVLHAIKRILKKGGVLIVSVPMNEGLEFMDTNPNGHVRDYNIDLIKAELKMMDFQVLKYKTFYAFQTNYNLKKLIARFIKRWNPNNIILKAISI